MKLDRRRALALLGLGAAAPAVSANAAAYAGKVAFNHGVASGDPTQDRVILWTRITPLAAPGGDIAYKWRLNPVDRRAGGAKSGEGITGPDRDYTAKVDVTGLEAGRAYTFEFEALGVTSPTGRTATLPAGSVEDVVLAVASCSLYPNGYFNAYQAIADLPRVDAVLHLGDYIYEYGGPGSYGMDSPVAGERPHDPPHEIVTLADYRRRHAQYKSDPALQAAHARAPWIVAWDDHETANNSFLGGAENHSPETEGDWTARKAVALKAYYEWMPIREPAQGKTLDAAWRSFHFGDLASLIMLETRLSARDHQLDYSEDLKGTSPEELAAFRAKLADPSRKMMGEAQHAWVAAEVKRSVAAGHAWQILGNQVVMARVNIASFSKAMGKEALDKALAGLPDSVRPRIAQMDALAPLNMPYGLDMWDGYPVDRQRLYENLAGANPIVVSGDSHAFWANELYDAPDGGRLVAVEFGTTGITSPGGGDYLTTVPLGEIYAEANREIVYTNQAAKGFVLLTLNRQEARGELKKVSTIKERTFETLTDKAFRVTPVAGGGVSPLSEV
ncbi:MAG: alkaline phosphatase D family protein [Phenylobacterium sp.]|uniref:alkaline phosphatase D family protein n=1 Tax=Phenylobacterium sp. TaxID=1871053 RepID=UPI00391DB2EE